MSKLSIPAMMAASFLLGSAAQAHVVADPGEGPAGGYFRTALRVPHGCGGKATNAVHVSLPEGPVGVKPQAKAGWQVEIRTQKLARPVDVGHGRTTDSRVSDVIWSGGNLPNSQFDEFGITLQLPAKAQDLWLTVTQKCDGDELRWEQIPAAGQSAHDLQRPAVLIRVAEQKPMMGGHGHDHAAAGHGKAAAAAGPVQIAAPFVRATPGKVGGVFLQIKNTGSSADRLIRAESPAAGSVELHTHVKDGDVMRMRQIPAIDVAANGETMLQPGGLHIMLIDLKQPLKEGGQVPLTLVFEKAGPVTVQVPVVKAGAMGSGHSH